MKNILIVLLILAISSMAFAQSKQAVHLKNGSIINGKVTKDGEKVSVQTKDGSLWVFDSSEVEKIDKANRTSYQKKKGWVSMSHFAFMVGKTSDEWSTSVVVSPSVRTFIGYQFRPKIGAGITLGIDGYSSMPLIPIAASFRGDLLEKSTTVYYGLDMGYAFPWSKEVENDWNGDWGRIGTPSSNTDTYKGGFFMSPMVGIKRYGPRGGGFYMQVAFTMQKASETISRWGITTRQEMTYKRLQIGVGLFF